MYSKSEIISMLLLQLPDNSQAMNERFSKRLIKQLINPKMNS